MFTLSHTEEILRPPDDVFAFAGDYAHDPAWRTGVQSMSYPFGGPPRVGATTRETMRSMGQTAITVAEITEYSSVRTAFRSLSGPVACHGWRQFVATTRGTRFTYALTLQPTGLLRLLQPLLRRMLARQIRNDVRGLKRLLEHPVALSRDFDLG